MILKALQILPYILASVNPSTFLANKKNATTTESTEYNYNLYPDYVTSQNTSNYYEGQTNYRYKYYAGKQTNEFLIRTYSYNTTNALQIGTNNYESQVFTTFNQYSNAYLQVIQITPYQSTKNNTINLTNKVRLNTSQYESYLDVFKFVSKLYSSTEDYWVKYMDYAITNPTLCYDAIQDITDSTQGFNYTIQTNTTDMVEQAQNSDPLLITNTFNIYINPNKVNYIYILNYLIYETETQAEAHAITQNGASCIYSGSSTTPLNIHGYTTASISSYEVVNIPGIMWEVLSMPFTFISIAFNLTLFPNTPYQINLSNLFLCILGILIFVFIIRMLLKIK